ncbi:MAG: hypothetical protein IKX98_03835, partial [Clostridia bacterium]|nr:hypothetical protein [Clostridia bacterium]
NDVARFTRSDVMCSANVPKAHITREAHITSEGRITFRVSGTHRSPSVLKNTRRKSAVFCDTGASLEKIKIFSFFCNISRFPSV